MGQRLGTGSAGEKLLEDKMGRKGLPGITSHASHLAPRHPFGAYGCRER